jgi:hypothetical protein
MIGARGFCRSTTIYLEGVVAGGYYRFEHNFGHDKQHLSILFAKMILLAFLLNILSNTSCMLQ